MIKLRELEAQPVSPSNAIHRLKTLTLLTKRLKLLCPKARIEGASPGSRPHRDSCLEPVTVIAISTGWVHSTLDSDLYPLALMTSERDHTFRHGEEPTPLGR